MTPPVGLETFDPHSREHARCLSKMYGAFLAEELHRTGALPPGSPVGRHLTTLLVRFAGDLVGFLSLDDSLNAVELAYVTAEHRGRGIARAAVEKLNAERPEPLRGKWPYTPAGQGLATSFRAQACDHTEDDDRGIGRKAAYPFEKFHQAVHDVCTHPRDTEDRGCQRCYATAFHKAAHAVVGAYLTAVRTGDIS